MEEIRNAEKVLIEKLKGRDHLGDLEREGKIKTCVKETECENVERIHLAQDGVQWWPLADTVMNLHVT
jgi:hypothetical protein